MEKENNDIYSMACGGGVVQEELDRCDLQRGSEELKKEWEREFEQEFGIHFTPSELQFAKSFISSLLSKQQDTPMGYSAWVAYGKKFGYHDYWKEMTRIALQEEFAKMVEIDLIKHFLVLPGNVEIKKSLREAVIDEIKYVIKSKLK
jgi:hypothetical protein